MQNIKDHFYLLRKSLKKKKKKEPVEVDTVFIHWYSQS